MADDSTTSHPTDSTRGSDRGPRPSGPREGGGFRIRLSDNEMQAARALQEAFGLRSTVAVLGFSLRTLAQQLENGELDELVARTRAQGGRPPGPRGNERRRERGEGGSGGGGGGGRGQRVDPFARPSRPAPAAAESEAPADSEPTAAEADLASEAADEVAAEAAPVDGTEAPDASEAEVQTTDTEA